MSAYHMTLNEFIEAAASKSHTPGGGSVSAVTGTHAAAMVSMVANLTMGKKKYADVEEEVKRILEGSTQAIEKLKNLTAADMEAFDGVMRAWRMSAETEEEKTAKDTALEKATQEATTVPLEICRVCLEVLKLASELAPIGNKSAISDVGVAAYLADAALRASLLNVDINLPALRDEAFRSDAEKEKQDLLSSAGDLKEKCLAEVRSRL